MQNSTGCKINVSPPAGADIERDIELVGPKTAIEKAKVVIFEKVDAVVSRTTPLTPRFQKLIMLQKEKNTGGMGGGNRRPARDDNFNDRYSQAQQSSYDYSQQPNQQAASATGADPAADPYAQYGGYQNYVALWYAAIAQQGQGQGATGDQQSPPGP
jgi:far upstream element-binding protein